MSQDEAMPARENQKRDCMHCRLWLSLALLACVQSGCAMCASDFDYFYPAYGGAICRDDMVCGRVNSAFCPAGGHPRAYDPDAGHVPHGQYVREDDGYSDSDLLHDGEQVSPYSEDTFELAPIEQLPDDVTVEEMDYEEEWPYGDTTWDDLVAGGEGVQNVKLYEPDYGYDDTVYEEPIHEESVCDDADYEELYDASSRDVNQTRFDDVQTFSDEPIGSGVATADRTERWESPRPIPRMRRSEPFDEEFIEKLVPLSAPPRPGFLLKTPTY